MNTEKEYKLLCRVLKSGVLIRYGKNEIEVLNKNDLRQTKTISVPSILVLKVKNFLHNPRLMKGEQWTEIRDYVSEVGLAIIEMSFRASTPKEKELKLTLFKRFLKEAERKYVKENEKKE